MHQFAYVISKQVADYLRAKYLDIQLFLWEKNGARKKISRFGSLKTWKRIVSNKKDGRLPLPSLPYAFSFADLSFYWFRVINRSSVLAKVFATKSLAPIFASQGVASSVSKYPANMRRPLYSITVFI